jgi:hypothetical protein
MAALAKGGIKGNAVLRRRKWVYRQRSMCAVDEYPAGAESKESDMDH